MAKKEMSKHTIVSSRRHFLQFLLLLTLALGSIAAANAQVKPRQGSDRRKSLSYVFVSPNTRENLTLAEAQAGLNSDEEIHLIAEAHEVACRLRKSLSVVKAIGSWSDGAEHSTLIRARTNESMLRYAGSLLGKFARQKAILYFRPDSSGRTKMYVLLLPRHRHDLAAVTRELDSDGIENRTLVPRKQGLLVYIVDLKNELRLKVLAAGRRLRARSSSLSGKGEFIGDDDRDKAQAVFNQEILKYEGVHPRVRQLRDVCKRRLMRPAVQGTLTKCPLLL